MFPYSGRTLILSGASRGVGRALALALAGRGVNLVLNARDPEPLRETASLAEALGARVLDVAGDCSRDEVCRFLAQKAVEMGGLAGFIHVAGVLRPGSYLWEISAGEAREVMDASYFGALALVRAVAPLLREAGGGLALFFGSGASERHVPGIGVYSAAKAAEEHLARQLAAEAPEITSLVLRPAVVETRMQQEARQARGGASEKMRPVFQAYRDTGQLLTPEEAARGVMNLLERAGDYRGRTVRVTDFL